MQQRLKPNTKQIKPHLTSVTRGIPKVTVRGKMLVSHGLLRVRWQLPGGRDCSPLAPPSHPAFQESPDTSASTPTILLLRLQPAYFPPACTLLITYSCPPFLPTSRRLTFFLGGKLHLSWSPSTHRQYSGIGIGMTLDNLTRSGWPACWVTRGGIKGKGEGSAGQHGSGSAECGEE